MTPDGNGSTTAVDVACGRHRRCSTLFTVTCEIVRKPGWLRVSVGLALADKVQECYRAAAMECLRGQCERVLVLGEAKFDPMAHLAGRDALRSVALAGVPPSFRLALVALTPNLVRIYDDAVVEASRLGLEARRFDSEAEAERWLQG
jgi:hypothetical protein